MLDVTRPCAVCGEAFAPIQAIQRYCSAGCRNKRSRALSPEAKAEQQRKDRQRYGRYKRAPRICPICGEQYHPTCGDQLYCRRRCGGVANRQRWPSCKVRYLDCAACGRCFVARNGRKACSKGCSYQLLLVSVYRRHALLKELESEDIDLLYIYERDKWTCQLCRRRVRRTPRRKHDPLMASPDHIVPVSEGGATTHANLRCTHLRCNKSRGNRGGNEQLRLVG